MRNPFKMDIGLSEKLQNQMTNIVPIAFLRNGSTGLGGEVEESAMFYFMK